MKKLLLGAVSAIALSLSVPANAADLAARPYTKAPPPVVAAIYDWSGFYIGLNGGYGSSHKCWDFVGVAGVLFSEGCHNATGGTVGGQIGYRWQSANWVFGLEGQGNWADFSGSNVSNIVAFGSENRTRIDAFGLITGQVGYAWNNVLLYVKGGGAVVRDKYDIFVAPALVGAGTLLGSASETRWGATVGAGVEVGFAPNWTVGFEYNHIFLGHRNIDFVTPAGAFFGTDRIGQDVDMGLVRVNYRWGGPVIAKY
ncbi:porin family protein [Bradyrhizobium diazoefficiens]|nr:outer membrane beta-barrel protein [Bradyrhizobium diazoefficiens]MBR0778214.1 porin family protein [Bradyrhizobium diazoefficiens]